MLHQAQAGGVAEPVGEQRVRQGDAAAQRVREEGEHQLDAEKRGKPAAEQRAEMGRERVGAEVDDLVDDELGDEQGDDGEQGAEEAQEERGGGERTARAPQGGDEGRQRAECTETF